MRTPVEPTDRWGLPLGVGVYLLWGIFPLYFPLLQPAESVEIIAHRLLWSLVFCAVLITVTRRWPTVRGVLARPKLAGTLVVAGALVTVNWLVYVYGVLTDHVLDASLGYFINPLVTVLLAVLVLRERLRPLQWVAVGIAGCAVAVITVGLGRVPWIALTLAVTFGLYGLVKKTVGPRVDAATGLVVETGALTPLALGYLLWLEATGAGTFGHAGVPQTLLLAASGVITAVPLLMFGAATRRLPLSVVGMLQYITPTMQFLLGVLVFHEQMSAPRWWGFAGVWIALVLLSVDALRTMSRHPRAPRTTPPPAEAEGQGGAGLGVADAG